MALTASQLNRITDYDEEVRWFVLGFLGAVSDIIEYNTSEKQQKVSFDRILKLAFEVKNVSDDEKKVKMGYFCWRIGPRHNWTSCVPTDIRGKNYEAVMDTIIITDGNGEYCFDMSKSAAKMLTAVKTELEAPELGYKVLIDLEEEAFIISWGNNS